MSMRPWQIWSWVDGRPGAFRGRQLRRPMPPGVYERVVESERLVIDVSRSIVRVQVHEDLPLRLDHDDDD